MEMAGRRNRSMTLQQAYDKACQLNPEVKKVLDHRAGRAGAAKPDNEELKRKRDAASSIAGGGPTGSSNKESVGDSLRGAIEDAFETQDRV